MLLETKALTKNFGGLAAVSEVDLYIEEGHIVGLIGPIGAGKATLINLISGFLSPSKGNIIFDGVDVTDKKPHHHARMGMGRTFQITPFFGEFTTFENIVASYYLSADRSFWGSLLKTRKYRDKEAKVQELAEKNMKFIGLERVRDGLRNSEAVNKAYLGG